MYPIRLYVVHLPNAVMIALAGVLNLMTWIWPLWQIGPQVDNIFLHYTVLYGVDFVGEWWRVFYVPLTGLVILLMNMIVGWMLFQRDKILTYMVLAMSVLCQIFLLVSVSLLVFLNV